MPLSNRARVALSLLPVVIILAAVFGVPIVTNNFSFDGINGHFIDSVYIPETGTLWFQTDGSFYYSSTVVTPGSYTISTKSLFNKIYTYSYDPVRKKILAQSKQTYASTPPQAKLFHVEDAILAVTPSVNRAANLELRDPKTFAVTRDLAGFQAKFPELASGIADLHLISGETDPTYARIKTRDGRDLVYDIATDQIFNGLSELRNARKASAPSIITRFALSSTDARLGLYKVTGPASGVLRTRLSNLYDPSVVRFQYEKLEVTHLVPDKAFLEAEIVYQDDTTVVVLSQNQIGKNADRMLTAVGADGKLLWVIPQAQLFPEAALRDSDDDSDIFFLKNKLHASKEGDLFIFKMDNVGIQAFDLKTGEKRWEFKRK